MNTNYENEYDLILENIYDIHKEIEQQFVTKKGVRDKDLIESAVGAVLQAEAYEQFPTILHKAARLCHGIATNHGFMDGNKRTGFIAMVTILDINGVSLEYTDDEMEEILINVVEHKITYEEFIEWLQSKQIKDAI